MTATMVPIVWSEQQICCLQWLCMPDEDSQSAVQGRKMVHVSPTS